MKNLQYDLPTLLRATDGSISDQLSRLSLWLSSLPRTSAWNEDEFHTSQRGPTAKVFQPQLLMSTLHKQICPYYFRKRNEKLTVAYYAIVPTTITYYMWPSWWKGGIWENANAFKRFANAFERVCVFFLFPFHQEGHIWLRIFQFFSHRFRFLFCATARFFTRESHDFYLDSQTRKLTSYCSPSCAITSFDYIWLGCILTCGRKTGPKRDYFTLDFPYDTI